jgi:hypothetical protein
VRPLGRFQLSLLLDVALPPQPGGFEGFGLGRVGAKSDDLPIAHCPHLPELLVDRNPAALAPSPLSEFALDGSKASGRKSWCKACDRDKARRLYAENRERVIARVQARNAKLREPRDWRGRRRSGRPGGR